MLYYMSIRGEPMKSYMEESSNGSGLLHTLRAGVITNAEIDRLHDARKRENERGEAGITEISTSFVQSLVRRGAIKEVLDKFLKTRVTIRPGYTETEIKLTQVMLKDEPSTIEPLTFSFGGMLRAYDLKERTIDVFGYSYELATVEFCSPVYTDDKGRLDTHPRIEMLAEEDFKEEYYYFDLDNILPNIGGAQER